MLKTRLLLIAVSAALIVGLFMLPKVVVENDSSVTQAPADSIAAQVETHAAAPPAVLAAIKKFRSGFDADSGNEKNAIFADSLASLYATAGKFDSSAWFAEEASKFFNTNESFVKVGDAYYQAYTFALDASRQAMFAAKAQSYYNKVLAANPDNLDVKTRLAMTYLTDANPMQAIMLLREVLAKDPKNEQALYNMGMLSIQSGQHQRAVERLTELVRINPDNVQGQLLLGVAYMNAGDKLKAKEQFQKVKLLDKDPSVQATVDSYLQNLK